MGDLESLITNEKAVFRISTGEITDPATFFETNKQSKMMAAKREATNKILHNDDYPTLTIMFENNPRCEFCVNFLDHHD